MFYKNYVRPRLFRHDSEEIHDRVIANLGRVGNTPIVSSVIKAALTVHDSRLEQKLFDMTFPNPVGLAAGMDKFGTALRGFEMLGFGFMELGGITALEQEGKPKPRMFRLPADEALINRMGFNNQGAEKMAYHLRSARLPTFPLGANIGKSMTVDVDDMDDVKNDCCYTLEKLHPFVDFFVVNVSSPNTPGLRGLQGAKLLKFLLRAIQRHNLEKTTARGERPKPILLKIAPDLSFQELDEILEVVEELGIDGIVATNTTIKRDGLRTTSGVQSEAGGLSGRPLLERTVEVVSYIHKKKRFLPIIGVGGIFSGDDAHRVILAGASLVQIYTGLVYEGPLLPQRINRGLLRLMERDGIKSMSGWNTTVNRV